MACTAALDGASRDVSRGSFLLLPPVRQSMFPTDSIVAMAPHLALALHLCIEERKADEVLRKQKEVKEECIAEQFAIELQGGA